MKEYLKALLTAAGYAAADIKTIMDNWDKADATIDTAPMIAAFKQTQFDLHSQDQEIVKKIDADVVGRQNGFVVRAAKRLFGLTSEDIKGKEDNIEEILKVAHAKINGGKDATVTQLQEKNLALENEIQKLKEEEMPKIRSEVDQAKKAVQVDRALDALVTKHSQNLSVDMQTALETGRLHMNANFIVDLDDKGNLTLKGKDGLQVKNEAGNGFMTVDDAWVGILKRNKFIKESNGNDGGGAGGGGGENNNGGGGDKTIKHNQSSEEKEKLYARFPHLRAADEKLERDKAEREKREAEKKK